MTDINEICHDYNYHRPRTYRKNARKDYLNLAKCKKRTAKIVSISQPYVRPIVCGKAAPVEFGAKLDLSIDENGMARLEKLSFDAYNKSDVLIGAIKRYHERTGHYLERALADKIYRNRENLAFCKPHGIRLSILVMNVARIAARSLYQFLTAPFSRCNQQDFLLICAQNCREDLLVA